MRTDTAFSYSSGERIRLGHRVRIAPGRAATAGAYGTVLKADATKPNPVLIRIHSPHRLRSRKFWYRPTSLLRAPVVLGVSDNETPSPTDVIWDENSTMNTPSDDEQSA